MGPTLSYLWTLSHTCLLACYTHICRHQTPRCPVTAHATMSFNTTNPHGTHAFKLVMGVATMPPNRFHATLYSPYVLSKLQCFVVCNSEHTTNKYRTHILPQCFYLMQTCSPIGSTSCSIRHTCWLQP